MTLSLRRSRERGSWAAWLIGLGLLIALAFLLVSDLAWMYKLGAWVLLTMLLDEAGNWFGYTAALLGALPFAAPLLKAQLPFTVHAAPPEWTTVFPLVFAGLVGALLVKHAGGLFGLLVSLALLAAPIVLARLAAPRLDPSFTLPADQDLLIWTVGPALLGAVFALIRRLVVRLRPAASAKPETA